MTESRELFFEKTLLIYTHINLEILLGGCIIPYCYFLVFVMLDEVDWLPYLLNYQILHEIHQHFPPLIRILLLHRFK